MNDQIEFTREQLYDLVWQKPMMRLAAKHRVTDVGLAKLCARHGIPTPPRGYWARLKAGNPPPRPPLPPSEDTAPISLQVADPVDDPQRALAAAVAHEKSDENRILVAERLHSPCDLVREAKEALNAAEPDYHGLLPRPPSPRAHRGAAGSGTRCASPWRTASTASCRSCSRPGLRCATATTTRWTTRWSCGGPIWGPCCSNTEPRWPTSRCGS